MNQELQVIEEIQKINIIQVIDEITREQASSVVLDLKRKRAQVVDYWKEPKDQAAAAHKQIVAKEKEMLVVIDSRITLFDTEIKKYLRDQEQKRIEAQKKADDEAKKKVDEDIKRKEDEQKALIESGDIEKAIELEDKPVVTPMASKVQSMPQKTVHTGSGTSTARKELVVEVKDLPAFFKYCAEKNLFNFFDVKQGMVKQWVKALALKDVPALNICEDVATQYRTAR
jgi:hypothetical protein